MKKYTLVGLAVFAAFVLMLFIRAIPDGEPVANLGTASVFPVISDLPDKDQQEILRLEAIPSAQRTASESAFLARRAVYLTNAIIDEDADGNIIRAAGLTVPEGYQGFAKGALFTVSDAASGIRGLWENVGTTSVAAWKVVGLQSASVTLSSASYSTIATTPVELVPDPGDGFVIQPISIAGYRVFSSESWAFGGNSAVDEGIEVKFDSMTGFAVFPTFSKGFSTGSASSTTASPSYQFLMPVSSIIGSASDALYLTASSSQTIDGDTSFMFEVQYRIIELP